MYFYCSKRIKNYSRVVIKNVYNLMNVFVQFKHENKRQIIQTSKIIQVTCILINYEL